MIDYLKLLKGVKKNLMIQHHRWLKWLKIESSNTNYSILQYKKVITYGVYWSNQILCFSKSSSCMEISFEGYNYKHSIQLLMGYSLLQLIALCTESNDRRFRFMQHRKLWNCALAGGRGLTAYRSPSVWLTHRVSLIN